MIASGLMLAAGKFWILDPLYTALGTVLAWFYAFIPSYGIAIILLTATVSLLRMPLVAKQVKSQQEMQRIQPELKRIQAKYKTEPQKRNEELMKLYKEHNVNPFAGCLPLVLQMPLFIVLYRLILNLNHRPEPKHIPRTSALFRALQESGGKMKSFGMDLAQSASKVHGAKLVPYAILIAVVIGTGLFQQRQMTARLPKDAVNTQVQIMGKVFPLFLGFISFSIPAGVVLYFFVSNVWQIGQQAVLFRNQPVGGGPPPTPDRAEKDKDTDRGDGGGGGGGTPKATGGDGGGAPPPAKPASGAPRGSGGNGGGSRRGGTSGGGGTGKGAPAGTRGPGGVARGSSPARGGAGRSGAASGGKGTGSAGAGSAGAAPGRSGGGFLSRLMRGGGVGGGASGAAGSGKSNGRSDGKGTGRASGSSGSSGRTGGNRAGGNGRATPPRSGSRPQGKAQPGPRAKPRNTRKGK